MLQKRVFTVAAMCAAMLAAMPALAEAAKGKSPPPAKVEGVLTSVAADSVSIQTPAGTVVRLAVIRATKVELNGRRVPILRLPVGARAQALYDAGTNIASKVEVTQ